MKLHPLLAMLVAVAVAACTPNVKLDDSGANIENRTGGAAGAASLLRGAFSNTDGGQAAAQTGVSDEVLTGLVEAGETSAQYLEISKGLANTRQEQLLLAAFVDTSPTSK